MQTLARMLLWILNLRILQVAVGVFVALMTIYWIWETRPFRKPEPVVPEDVQQVERRLYCLGVLAGDDAQTPTQQLFVVHAAMNVSDQGLTVCKVHELKVTLLAPSEQGTGAPRYPEAAAAYDNSWLGDPENASRGRELAKRVIKPSERRADYQKQPCLAHVIAYLRIPKWGTTQSKQKMDAELEPLYTEGRFVAYGPKGTQAKCR